MDYHLKYKKYKYKYFQLKRMNDDHKYDFYDEYEKIREKIKKEIITESIVKEIIDLFRNDYDIEIGHMLEDDLMTKFIIDVAEGKIKDINTIQIIASLIKEITDMGKTKWYA